jgi:hypothetical protein
LKRGKPFSVHLFKILSAHFAIGTKFR